MKLLMLYASTQARPDVLNLALDLANLGYTLRPLSQLPPSDRLAPLRREWAEREVELASVQRQLRAIERGQVAHVAGQLDGLKHDEDALRSRLRAIGRSLSAQQKGATPDD